jgi:hypothetical protein
MRTFEEFNIFRKKKNAIDEQRTKLEEIKK